MINIKELEVALNTQTAISVLFRTKTGSLRTMVCSRVPNLSEEIMEGLHDVKFSSPDIIAVWDYQNFGFRAFRKDSVISWELVK
jgi:hypothetical protein